MQTPIGETRIDLRDVEADRVADRVCKSLDAKYGEQRNRTHNTGKQRAVMGKPLPMMDESDA